MFMWIAAHKGNLGNEVGRAMTLTFVFAEAK